MYQTISEPNELTHAILEHSTEAVLALNRQWHLIYINPEAEKLLGFTASVLEGKTFWESFPNGIGAAFNQQFEERMTDRTAVEFEAYSTILSRWIVCRVVPHFSHGEFESLFIYARDTTAHHQALEELQQRSQTDGDRLAAIVNSSDDVIYSKNLDGIITTWNQAGERLYGHTPEEAIGQHISFFIPEEHIHRDEQAMQDIQAGMVAEPFETHRRRKDGTLLQVESRISPLRNEQGQVIGASVISRDITPRKRQQEELETSETRYRRLFEAAKDGILILDANTSKITDANPFMTEMLGFSREELRGKELAELGFFKDEAEAHEAMEHLHRDSYIRYDDLPLETKNHEHRDVEFVSNVYAEDGHNVIQCNIRDNTERNSLKKAAATHERERDYVLSAARCLLYYANVTESDHPNQLFWDTHFVDEAAAQVFMPLDIAPGETYTHARYRSRHPEDREACDALGTRMIRAGKSYNQEFRSFCTDGSIRWVREDVQVETIVPGKSWRVVCVCTDITLMKEHQRALEVANDRLQRAMTETHHRVKNNLQIIAAMVDMQVMEGTETLPTSAVKRLGEQVAALAALHGLLTEEAKKDTEARSLDAFAVFGKLLPLIQAAAGTTKIDFQGDHARLSINQAASLCLIANEIITNAVKFGRGTVNVTFHADDKDAELIVEDNGPGFPEGFDPETMSGNGLELMCHLARLDLGGSIIFETRKESGGRVTLKMPNFAQALLAEAKSMSAS